MKKLVLLIAGIVLSVSAFAQSLTISDLCYWDSSNGTVETYSYEQIINRLANRGFSVTVIESSYDPDYGNYYLYSVYNSYSNTQLIIDVEGPGKIVFNSTSEANAFVNKAVSLGYFSWQNGKYYITYEPEFCGICAMRLSGNTVIFDLIVL
ncbi:MAG: hypothetical protein IKV04_04780 [Alistipes sp.]|nr:hypothetical protein [Alistipes sp.]